MAGRIDARLKELAIELPTPAIPVAAYVPAVRTGNTLFLSGQIPFWNGELRCVGKLGDNFTVEQGAEAARLCALNLIAQAKAALDGDLDRMVRVVKLVGFVNSTGDFTDQPKVINGASETFVQVFGDAGRHARSAVSAAALPLGVAVEVEAILEVA
ncbi:RidA family protein [Nitrospirillum pindoramense]|uniref:Enamine deaminase RidA (YjgF/YER057c/UK114 family) n=1 Tax=Nitrospirillum amazonense TaxID=28077 RepID=A0A560HI28_9PROT|nr:RidA family protein [Nitrospirillum amazonense]TWB46106.1 enamine deaminase RidA (YjgF/YER057c/UK114 family) [Nitrospirillum amazonense]